MRFLSCRYNKIVYGVVTTENIPYSIPGEPFNRKTRSLFGITLRFLKIFPLT